MPVGVQINETANPPLHADSEHQLEVQLIDKKFLLAERQAGPCSRITTMWMVLVIDSVTEQRIHHTMLVSALARRAAGISA